MLQEVEGLCASLAAEATEIIRQVQSQREKKLDIGTCLKDPNDSRSYLTHADILAQQCIVHGLLNRFPTISIIAEEDQSNIIQEYVHQPSEPVKKFDVHGMPQEYDAIETEDLCVFIDPVDGTREFVQGRLESVQTLIGIAWRGRPIAGVIGLPFHHHTDTQCIIRCIVGVSLIMGPLQSLYNRESDDLVIAVSAEITEPLLKRARAALGGVSLVAGGCGNKAIRVACGQADAALFNLGTSLWDTCATEALVVALGGEVTTLAGYPITYTSQSSTANTMGVVITGASFNKVMSHQEMCSRIHFDENWQVARDIHGNVLSNTILTEWVGMSVSSFSCPVSESISYKQSAGGRIHLKYQSGETGSVFLKRVVLRELPHARSKSKDPKQQFKLLRDVKSILVESRFLQHPVVKSFSKHVAIGEALFIDQKVFTDVPMDSRFLLCLKDFSPREGWYQIPLLKDMELRLTLDGLARFHSYFWGHASLNQQVWSTGGYWQLFHQGDYAEQIANIEPNWARLQTEFNWDYPHLGVRLSKVALTASESLQSETYSTVIHGDPKAPNFFFKDGKLGMIDFQWTGVGLGAVDVAYCIAASAHDSLFENMAEYLAYYHEQLMVYFVEDGLASSLEHAESFFPMPVFQAQFRSAFLDLVRVVIGDHWKTITKETFAARDGMLAFNAYNKSLKVASWIVKLADSYLKMPIGDDK